MDNLHQVKGISVSVFRSLNTRPLKIPHCLLSFSPSVVFFVLVQRQHIMFLAMYLCVYQCDMKSNTLQMHFQGSGTEPLSKTGVTFQTKVLGEAFRCFTSLNGLRSLQQKSTRCNPDRLIQTSHPYTERPCCHLSCCLCTKLIKVKWIVSFLWGFNPLVASADRVALSWRSLY